MIFKYATMTSCLILFIGLLISVLHDVFIIGDNENILVYTAILILLQEHISTLAHRWKK